MRKDSPQRLVKKFDDSDIRVELVIHTKVEQPTAPWSLIETQFVAPPVVNIDDDSDLWDIGPPLAESSVIYPSKLDESGVWPLEPFYQDDVSFNLDDIFSDLQEEVMSSAMHPPMGFVVNASENKLGVEALDACESSNIDDIYKPCDEEALKTNVTPLPIEMGVLRDTAPSFILPISGKTSVPEVAVAKNGSDAPDVYEEHFPIEKEATAFGVVAHDTASSAIPSTHSRLCSDAEVAVAEIGFDAPAEEVPEAQPTFEDFLTMTGSIIQGYLAARDRKGENECAPVST